jgi:mannitol/fructose-specific phosphotransferase system IIA component
LSADAEVLSPEAIRLGLTAAGKRDAIVQCGQALVEIGAVTHEYIESMCERENGVSTFVGRGVSIPHGTESARQYVRRTALAVLQFPAGVDWAGDPVSVCVAIAADGDKHVGLMSMLAQLLLDERRAEELCTADDPQVVLDLLRGDSGRGADEPRPIAPNRPTAPTMRRPTSVRARLGYPPAPRGSSATLRK